MTNNSNDVESRPWEVWSALHSANHKLEILTQLPLSIATSFDENVSH